MTVWVTLLNRLDIIAAGLGILLAAKSIYNGGLRSLINNIQEIPQINERVESMRSKQEDMVDGMIALSIAEEDDEARMDTDRLARDLRDGASYRVYLNRDSPNNAYADVEDEEVAEEPPRWRGESGSDDD